MLVRLAPAALIAAGVVSGCTVRVELASSRAVPGDLAATSSGLAPHRSLAQDVADERPQPAAQGLAVATLLPADASRGPVEFLPGQSKAGPSRARPQPAIAPGPVAAPAPRPADQTFDETATPVLGAGRLLARPDDRHETRAPVVLPAAGPP